MALTLMFLFTTYYSEYKCTVSKGKCFEMTFVFLKRTKADYLIVLTIQAERGETVFIAFLVKAGCY